MKSKKYSVDQRLKKLEKSVGELYLFMRVVLSLVIAFICLVLLFV